MLVFVHTDKLSINTQTWARGRGSLPVSSLAKSLRGITLPVSHGFEVLAFVMAVLCQQSTLIWGFLQRGMIFLIYGSIYMDP